MVGQFVPTPAMVSALALPIRLVPTPYSLFRRLSSIVRNVTLLHEWAARLTKHTVPCAVS